MKKPRWHTMQPAPITQAYFISKPITIQKDWNKTRVQAGKILSSPAQLKLE